MRFAENFVRPFLAGFPGTYTQSGTWRHAPNLVAVNGASGQLTGGKFLRNLYDLSRVCANTRLELFREHVIRTTTKKMVLRRKFDSGDRKFTVGDVMRRSHSTLLLVSVIAMLGTAPNSQEPAPREAFKSVHFVTLTADEATMFLAALVDVNAALEEAGHSEIRYRLYKVVGKQAGDYNYMWESSWPSGTVYDEVLKSPAFISALKKHPITERIRKNEVYNRYVEVTSSKP